MNSRLRDSPLRWLPGAMLALWLAASSVWAQSTSDLNTQQQINALMKKIADLEESQRQMQKTIDRFTASAPTPPAAPVAPIAAPAPAIDEPPPDLPDEHFHVLGPVQFAGFTDFNYGRAVFENLPPTGLNGSSNGFGLGDLDLFTNTELAEHWSLLAEVLFTSDFSNQISADIDRLMVTFRPNDYFNISVGKFNTAIGYYPNAFHRARYFQVATGRPLMYSDEDAGGILPVHSVGVTTTGKINSGSLGLHWVAEVSNGRGSETPSTFPIQNFADENNGKAVDGALYARPSWLPGFEFGASLYHDTEHPLNIASVRQFITAGHIVYVGSKFHWLNEAASIRHAQDGSDQVYHSLTAYTEISRAFGGTTPYFRFDYQNVPTTDPIFGLATCLVGEQCSGGRRDGPSIGANRRLSQYIVLKVQYGRLSQRALKSANDFQVQLGIAF